MKKDSYSNHTIMDILGVNNVSQIKTWMTQYRTDQTYRFQQPVGKQYSYGKRSKELSELERLRLKNIHLKTKLFVEGKELKPHAAITLWNKLKSKITVQELCKVLELPRSSFYCQLQKAERPKGEIEEKIKTVCLRHKLRYGYRRMTATLRKMGLCVNHKKYYEL